MGKAVRLWRGPRHGGLVEVHGPHLKIHRLKETGPKWTAEVLLAATVDTEVGYYEPTGHTDGQGGHEIWAWGGWQDG